ncbi:MAG: TetR/AcrR family transcriptional regulator [Lachnospiraceae bacterium]|nr:TetR/AcrR family transcriptional regulator [Lachnospiraceae bacterium]
MVVHAAITLIEEKGNQNFSMRELADMLQVKTAALYNHV